MGYTFVDDTDLIQSSPLIPVEAATNGLQLALDTWEGGLKATGGAIVPEKTFWYLASFKWVGQKWAYNTINDAPGSIYVNDIQGNRKLLRQFETSHAEVTLGVALAPDGNVEQQTTNTKTSAIKWADAMQAGSISKHDARLSFSSTIWHTLTYPVNATNLSENQCDSIMTIILQYLLPAIGICRRFPRAMVYAPKKYLGLGILNSYTI